MLDIGGGVAAKERKDIHFFDTLGVPHVPETSRNIVEYPSPSRIPCVPAGILSYICKMILNGKQLADSLKEGFAAQVASFRTQYGRVPHLTVILAGDDPASRTYVRNKELACERVGFSHDTVRLPASVSETEILGTISRLNADPSVDGILVQLPLPAHVDEQKVIDAIDRSKDVDGFHPLNVADLWLHRQGFDTPRDYMLPCTPKGIVRMLRSAGVRMEGANAVVIGRSNIVGLPVAKLLLNENATVTICHSRTRGLAEMVRRADIVVAAIGRPRFVTADMVAPGAVVIDVGINRDAETGKLCGDVDFDAVSQIASVISPVPGGVGPMTICMLLENTIECFLRRVSA